jgi:hypothetical protein
MIDRIKPAQELPRAEQTLVAQNNGSRPRLCTPEEIGEFVELARKRLPQIGQSSTNSTGVYVQKAIYPEDSILADWMMLARKHEESADAFIIGSILPVCGALLGRRVWVQWGEKQKFANCFIMLAGKPGDRKSSIIDLSEMLARLVLPENAFLPKSFSPETLFDQYCESEGGRPDKTWIVDDANAVLIDWRKAVNGERVATRFLELYDCKGISEHFRRNARKKKAPRREIYQTSTNIVFGATFNIACFQGQTLRAGLARRFLYYVAENHGRVIVRPPRKDQLGLKALAEGFRDLEKIKGPMDFDPRAAALWEQYQRENRAEIEQTDSLQEARLSHLASAPMQTLSVAMIFEATRWAKKANSQLFTHSGHWHRLIDEQTLNLAIEHTKECLKAAEFLDSIANKAEIAREAEILLAHVRRDFFRNDDFIFVTRTDLTRTYCKNSGRSGSWKPDDLYLRFIPHLQRRGEACLLAQRGKQEWFAFPVE